MDIGSNDREFLGKNEVLLTGSDFDSLSLTQPSAGLLASPFSLASPTLSACKTSEMIIILKGLIRFNKEG